MKTPAAFPFFSHRTQAEIIAHGKRFKRRAIPEVVKEKRAAAVPREIQLAIDRAEVDFEIWRQEQAKARGQR